MKTINLYHLFGILRYGEVIDNTIHFDHCWYRGAHFLPCRMDNFLKPIFKVKNGVYPTPQEWSVFLKSYAGR